MFTQFGSIFASNLSQLKILLIQFTDCILLFVIIKHVWLYGGSVSVTWQCFPITSSYKFVIGDNLGNVFFFNFVLRDVDQCILQ